MSWDVSNERLLLHIVLDDTYAQLLSDRAGTAFFRAFIVELRATGKIMAKFRFRYRDGTRSWYESSDPERSGQSAVEYYCSAIHYMLFEAARIQGTPLPERAFEFFEPPDDGGNGLKTVAWLEERGLIEITGVEEVPN